MPSLLLQFDAEPPAELFKDARGGTERLEILKQFYAVKKKNLRTKLQDKAVEVTDLGAMGSVVVSGSPVALAELTRPGGDLERLGVTVAEEAEFLPLGSVR